MNFQCKSNDCYFKRLIFPVIWQAIFIISCIVFPKQYCIYTNFLFYLGIIIYFFLIGDFKYDELVKNIKSGRRFWKLVIVTALTMIAAFLLGSLMSILFPNCSDGMIPLRRSNWIELIVFAVSTIIFPPLAEELFYRQAIIRFDGKIALFVSSFIGMILYALEHSLTILGVVETMIVAVPVTISYIKTKNIYVPITAHFIVNLIGNGLTVIFTALSFVR